MQPLHLAIGIFDGVHAGHRHLIGEMVRQAQIMNHTAVALTFHPHPKRVLQLPQMPQLIYPIQQRHWLLKQIGCDHIYIAAFTREKSRLSPDEFFQKLLQTFPSLIALYVGEDFHFGHHRSGDIHTLQTLCKGTGKVRLHIFQHLLHENQRICSTYIREILQHAPIEYANHLLGWPYHVIGVIEEKMFHHRCELNVKDGLYRGCLKNKYGQQMVTVSVVATKMQLQTQPKSFFQKNPCQLQFECDL